MYVCGGGGAHREWFVHVDDSGHGKQAEADGASITQACRGVWGGGGIQVGAGHDQVGAGRVPHEENGCS